MARRFPRDVSMHRGCININELGRQEYYMVDLSYSLLWSRDVLQRFDWERREETLFFPLVFIAGKLYLIRSNSYFALGKV